MDRLEPVSAVGLTPVLESTSGEKKNYGASEEKKRPFAEGEARPGEREFLEAVEKANETMALYRTELRFLLDEKSGEYMVKVINAETKEVLREIPPEWVLKLVADVKEMIGLILDKFI